MPAPTPYSIEEIKRLAIEHQVTSYIMFGWPLEIGEPVPFFPRNNEHKLYMISQARRISQELRISSVWLVFEAWMASVASDSSVSHTEARKALPDDLADAPGRVDTLVCQFESRTDGLQLHTFEIDRDSTGRIIGLRERSIGDLQSGALWILENPDARAVKH